VLQFCPLILVEQVKLASIFVIPIGDVDEWTSVVRQAGEKLLFDLLKLSRRNFVGVVGLVKCKAEELVLVTELRSEERVDESDVVVDAANLEDFLAT